MNDLKYSLKKTLLKMLKYFVIFGIPFFISTFPTITNLTIGTILLGILNWAKSKWALEFIP